MTVERQTRLDRSEIAAHRNANGYLVAEVRPSRIGLLTYRSMDGKVWKELRIPDEVFSEASLETLKSVPLTLEHPPTFLNPENTHLFQIGHVRDDVSNDGRFITASAVVTHTDAIRQIEEGVRREVSCGYTCDLEPAPEGAVWDGEAYDFIQRNITYNHLALVSRGRAGPEASFRVDGYEEDATLPDGNETQEKFRMKKVKIGDAEFEVPEEVAAHIAECHDNLDKCKKRGDTLQGECDALKTQVDVEKRRADSLVPTVEQIDALVKERLDVIEHARKHAPDFDCNGKSLAEIRAGIVAKKLPNVKIDGMTEEYVRAAFDVAVAHLPDPTVAFAEKTAKKGEAKVDHRAAAIEASKKLSL